jgi:hypothetical protein
MGEPMVDKDIVLRVQAEYTEMPGLRLTVPQASRLWQLEPAACETILSALVEQHSLVRTQDGAYVRRDVRG